MKRSFFIIFLLLVCLFSCKKKTIEDRLIGYWIPEYEILEDGTKKYSDNWYALLEFTYSEGFTLNDDGTGAVNKKGDGFEWSNTKKKLTILVTHSNGNIEEFEYLITNVKKNNMDFETPKGHKYHMSKQ